jgi:alkylation response protein AidB-like acyl-CoA dehydrogenase
MIMDFAFTDEQEMLRSEIQRFCEKELTRDYVRWMDENCDFIPDDLWNKLADMGAFGVTLPEEYGGAGLGFVEAMIASEELATASTAVALGIGATIGFGAKPVLNLGTDQQKKEILPPLARDCWLMNGQKIFITGAHVADYILTVAITDPEAKRTKGLSVFMVPRPTPGLETRLIPKVGCHACGASEIYYDDVRIPKENILGTLHNGWFELLGVLNPERIGTAAISLGIAKAAFRDAMAYAQERNAFGGPIGRFQSLQHYLADIAIEIENARNLIYKCAWLADNGKPTHLEACMAKIVAGRASEKAAILGMEILGGYGYTMDYDMQRYFRDYKQMIFSPISDEMAKNMIMQFMGMPRSW